MKPFTVYIQPFSADVEIAIVIDEIYMQPSRDEAIIDHVECSIDGIATSRVDEKVIDYLYDNHEELLQQLTAEAWQDREEYYQEY